MLTKIKAVLIDLDNVLYNTELFHYMSWKTMCSETGLPFDREQFMALKGMDEEEGLEKVLSFNPWFSAPPVLKDMLSTKVRLLYRQYLVSLTPSEVSEDVRQTLAEIRAGYKVLVYSSGESARNVLEKLGLEDKVDAIYSSRIVSPRKEDTAAFEEMASMLELSSEECLVVESTASGIHAAMTAGMMTVFVGEDRESESNYGIKSFSDIKPIL